MKKFVVALISLFMVVILSIVGYVLYSENRIGEELNVKENRQVLDNVKVQHELAEASEKWVDDTSVGHDHGALDIAKAHRDIPHVLTFFAQTLLQEDVDFFSKVFEPNTFSADLSEVDNPNKIEVVMDMIKQLTRDGKLEDIAIIEQGITKGEKYVDVTFLYTDDYKAKVTIQMIYGEGENKEDQVLLVTDSVWNLIEQVQQMGK
ncbi:hypothetical protein [Bacillus sp. SM2101]|uniref:hypothetical protein n=1 Tax=Bacillus sp. SM2101 TaxID=2805366 RepID=UPI001BDE23CE|nr:hypothetical protein [Bacillus sp. SM2101]